MGLIAIHLCLLATFVLVEGQYYGGSEISHASYRPTYIPCDARWGFSATFPNRERNDYIRFDFPDHGNLRAFTICMWLRPDPEYDDHTLISYGVEGGSTDANDIRIDIDDGEDIGIYINGEDESINNIAEVLFDGYYHHICLSWSVGGQYMVYIDGYIQGSGQFNGDGADSIPMGGCFLFGSDQDSFCDDFEQDQVYVGVVQDVVMFSYVLPPGAIAAMSQTCYNVYGDLISWTRNTHVVFGHVDIRRPPSCPFFGNYPRLCQIGTLTREQVNLLDYLYEQVRRLSKYLGLH